MAATGCGRPGFEWPTLAATSSVASDRAVSGPALRPSPDSSERSRCPILARRRIVLTLAQGRSPWLVSHVWLSQ